MASFGILANKNRLEAQIAEAKKSVTKQKRIDRELNKVQSGGRVSSFLKREAEKNEVLSASLGIATASGPLAFGQALIKYEDAINRVNVSDELKTEDQPTPEIPAPESLLPAGENAGDLLYWDGEAWVILPPPSGTDTKVLASTGGVPFWLETEECE
jgi:hypothetical protein